MVTASAVSVVGPAMVASVPEHVTYTVSPAGRPITGRGNDAWSMSVIA
jgi:hypothetical protein